MNRIAAWGIAALCALSWSLSVPVLAQSKGGSSREVDRQKSEQSRDASRTKSRDSAPTVNKSDQRRDGSRSGSKSRR